MTTIALGQVRRGHRIARPGVTAPTNEIDFRNANRIKGALIAVSVTSVLWGSLIGGASFLISLI